MTTNSSSACAPRVRRMVSWAASGLLVAGVVLSTPPAVAYDAMPTPSSLGGTVTAWGSTSASAMRLADVNANANTDPVVSVAGYEDAGVILMASGMIRAWGVAGTETVPQLNNAAVTNPVRQVVARAGRFAAITADGRVTEWGTSPATQPTRDALNATAASNPITQITMGVNTTVALTANGAVTQWGSGLAPLPAAITGPTPADPAVQISANSTTNLALGQSGKVYVWGTSGPQLSLPSGWQNPTDPVVSISNGENFALTLTRSGTVIQWGTLVAPPATLNSPANPVLAISAGRNQALALLADGQVVTWGNGENGLNTPPNSLAPTADRAATSVAAGGGNAFVITATRPMINGNPVVGGTLTASTASDPGVTSYRWLADGQPVAGAISSSLNVTEDMRGKSIRVLLGNGSANVGVASAATQPITYPEFTDITHSILGAAQVGHTMTAQASSTPASDAITHSWTRDDDTDLGQASSYSPTPADVGHTITLTTTFTRAGYTTATRTSVADSVSPGTFATANTTITGIPSGGSPLTAQASSTPASDAITHSWTRDDDTDLGQASSYSPTPADVGHTITLTTTFTREGYATATKTATIDVEPLAFDNPTVDVSGAFRVGETLTARATPASAANTTYVWSRGNTVIATGPTYTTVSADEGRQLKVSATLESPYTASTTASATTPAIATNRAPLVSFTIDKTRVREGQTVTLTWNSARAKGLRGTWSNSALPDQGSVTLPAGKAGTRTWSLTADNDYGSVTAQVSSTVSLPRATLRVTAPRRAKANTMITIKVSGLAPKERTSISIGPRTRFVTATSTGTARVTMRNLRPAATRSVRIKATGSMPDRTGQRQLLVVVKKKRR